MDKKHVMSLQGKDFVTYEGLLDEAHKKGLKSITTALVQVPGPANDQTAICVATAVFLDKEGVERTFTGIGDASPRNVSRGILPHIIRMSETRSKARALRDGTNIGMAAYEEMMEADLPREDGAPHGQSDGVANINAHQAAKAAGVKLATKAQIEAVTREMTRTGTTPEQGRDYLQEHFKKISRSELTTQEIEAFLAHLKGQPAAESMEA